MVSSPLIRVTLKGRILTHFCRIPTGVVKKCVPRLKLGQVCRGDRFPETIFLAGAHGIFFWGK